MKTARFKDVVAKAGAPAVHPLWLAPDKDPGLRRAVKECRVLTIHQALRGTKKDYGTVGLQLEGSTQVLVFPKSLRRFGDRHIVGIDYTLIVRPDPKDPVPLPKPPPPKRPVVTAPKSQPVPDSKHPKAPKRAPPKKREPVAAQSKQPKSQPAPAPRRADPLKTRDELLVEIRRALRDLKSGKAVAAYERLNALVAG